MVAVGARLLGGINISLITSTDPHCPTPAAAMITSKHSGRISSLPAIHLAEQKNLQKFFIVANEWLFWAFEALLTQFLPHLRRCHRHKSSSVSWKQRWHGRNIWVAIVEGWVAAESFVAFLNSLPCLLKTCEKVRRSGHDLPIGRLDLTKGDNGPSTPSGIGSTRQNIIITEASLWDDVTYISSLSWEKSWSCNDSLVESWTVGRCWTYLACMISACWGVRLLGYLGKRISAYRDIKLQGYLQQYNSLVQQFIGSWGYQRWEKPRGKSDLRHLGRQLTTNQHRLVTNMVLVDQQINSCKGELPEKKRIFLSGTAKREGRGLCLNYCLVLTNWSLIKSLFLQKCQCFELWTDLKLLGKHLF